MFIIELGVWLQKSAVFVLMGCEEETEEYSVLK